MIDSIFNKITKFYQICLVSLMVVTLGSVLYFWKLGFIDGSKGQDLHQASFQLEAYTKKNQFKEVKNLIFQENPKGAIQKIKAFEGELKSINRLVEVKEYEQLKDQIKALKISSEKLIVFSKSEKIVSVFTKKLNHFYDYVKSNSWRTLTRMSDRVYSNVSGHLNKNKLHSLANNILRDFNSMAKITENSILSRKDKAEIISRVTNLKIEMEMLKNYANQRSEFNKQYNMFEVALNNWLEKVSPEVTLSKIKLQDIGRYYVIGMLCILFMMTSLYFISFFFNRYALKKANHSIEEKLERLISDGLLAGDSSETTGFSQDFQKYAEKISKYIDKRMSFGSIFQDALPLSSILLDQNLKVVWANNQFCDDWEISEEEIKKDYMSWDYLNKLTNIGADDPVLEALKHNVAGIYQVQVKPHDESGVRPFEMFVSPIKHQDEKRIMLFFYDLTNLEDTISDQAKSILAPVKQTVNQLKNGHFVADDQLAYEFNIAGISDIYTDFLNLNDEMKDKEEELTGHVKNLHSKINEYDTNFSQVHKQNLASLDNSKSNIEALKVFKENVIGLSGLTHTLDRVATKSSDTIYTNINTIKNSINKIESLKSLNNEFVESMPKYLDIKTEIKETKTAIQDSRTKLAHELSQLGMLMKRAGDASSLEKLTRTLGKINLTFETLAQNSAELDKKLSGLEIFMSKAQIIMNCSTEKMKTINSQYEVQQVQFAEQESKIIQNLKTGSTEKINSYEQGLIEALQNIFKGTKSNLVICNDIRNQNIELDENRSDQSA